jgi:hypothetical protein
MPAFPFTQALTASQVDFRPLAGWQYRRLLFQAYCRLLVRTTGAAGTVKMTVYSGSDTIIQRSPVQVGGVAGTTPTSLNTPQVEWIASPGDELIVSIDETAGAVPTVDGIIYVDPI